MSEFTNRIFQKALKFAFANSGLFESQKALALTAKVGEAVVSDLMSGNRNYGERSHLKIANAFGKTLEDFYLIGIALEEGHPIGDINPYDIFPPKNTDVPKKPRPKKPKQAKVKVLSAEHKGLIDSFQNKKAAYEINKNLITIERIDGEEFERIKEYIEFIRTRLESKKIAGNGSE